MKENAIKKALNDLRKERRDFIFGKTFSENCLKLEYVKGLDKAIQILKYHLEVYKHCKE